VAAPATARRAGAGRPSDAARSKAPADGRSADPRAREVRRPRRSRGSRALRAVGIAVVLLVVAVGGVLVWGIVKLNSLERVDVALAAAGGDEPINFLLVGSDTRAIADDGPDSGAIHGKGAPAGQRADTILIARVDPKKTSVELLSIPRDLWVTRKGKDGATFEGRINAAYNDGAQALIDTVKENIGVPINHYVEVNFSGFKGLVDAIGGVPMYFDRPVYDNNSGLRIRQKGCYNLDPVQSLAFARSRHLFYSNGRRWVPDPTGDMGRVTRQQIFLRRAMAKISTLGIDDLNTMRRLVNVGVDSVKVDSSLSIDMLMSLGRRFRSFDSSAMVNHRLATQQHTTNGGADVLLLDDAASAHLIDVFNGRADGAEGTAAAEEGDGSGEAPLLPSSATVDVLNGAGTKGLASKVSGDLAEAGFVAGEVGNAPSPTSRTEVRYAKGDADLAALLADGLAPGPQLVEDATLTSGRLQLVVGRDFDGVTAQAASSTTTTSTTAAASSGETGTTTTVPVTDQDVGFVIGDPPPGVRCG